MKQIKAIPLPLAGGRIVRALHKLPHVLGLTVARAAGQRRGQSGPLVISEVNLFPAQDTCSSQNHHHA